jgi:peptide chain release factor subunit 1
MSTHLRDQEIEKLKMKRLLDSLEEAQGQGTSMVTLLVPPGPTRLAATKKKVTDELGTSAQIKSRV